MASNMVTPAFKESPNRRPPNQLLRSHVEEDLPLLIHAIDDAQSQIGLI